jgi:hypothetical protein
MYKARPGAEVSRFESGPGDTLRRRRRANVFAKRSLLFLLCAAAAWHCSGRTLAQSQHAATPTGWSFVSHFRNGITGWLSYPLVQDEGYDPTLYVKQEDGEFVLVRNVTAFGQHILRVGLIRPLKFHALPASEFHLEYSLQTCGRLANLTMKLAGGDGKAYTAAVPGGSFAHSATIAGSSFSLPPSGDSVQAVVVEAKIAGAPRGSPTRLVVRRLEISAERLPHSCLPSPNFEIKKTPPHPRILLTASRLAQLRSTPVAGIVREKAAQIRKTLAYNVKAGTNISLMSPVSVFPGLPQYFQLMDTYGDAIALNALDYRMNGDDAALASARRALDCVAAWKTWTPPWFAAHGLRTYYEVGWFMQKVAFGYDLVADRLSAAEKARIADAFWQNGVEPTLEEYFFNDRLPDASSNWMANSVGGALAGCAAVYGDAPNWNKRFGIALGELIVSYENLLQGLFPGDGSEAEPAGYENFAMEGMSWGAAALQSMGIRPRGMSRMLHSFWWLRYAQFAPGKFLDTGDFGTDLPALSGYAWAAESAADPVLRAFYESAQSCTLAVVLRVHHTGRALEQAPGLLDLLCCTQPAPKVVPAAPDARIFPGRRSAVMRSGWRPGSTVISVRVGPWFNHEHHDQGSFQVAMLGQKLITEAGYTDYYKDPRYANYFSQAPAHNTVILDGDAFSQEDYDGRDWKALDRFATFSAHVFSPHLDYLSANLAPAYDDLPLKKYLREFVFIKPDIVIVHDSLEANSPRSYTFFLHIPAGDRYKVNGRNGLIRSVSALAALTAAGETSAWKVHSARIPVAAYSDLDRDAVEPRAVFRLDTRPSKAADFFVAMHFQPGAEKPAFPVAVGGAFVLGFRSAGEGVSVWFRASGEQPLSAATPFGLATTDSDIMAVSRERGTLDIFVSGASRLKLGRNLVLSARPARFDADVRESSRGLQLYADCLAPTNLRITASRKPSGIMLDGKRMSQAVQGRTIKIRRLTEGQHVIRIYH